jgi:GDP-mannose 6-dehydrogenase
MLKYVSNTFHALKIAFANEIGDVCGAFGVDPQELMRIFMMDRKLNISEMYLRPGFAFGGSCLPKDLRALIYAARSADVALPLLSSILPSNDGQIREQVDAVLKTRKRKVGIVGLSFKPATDDLRESPMVTLAEALIGKGCDVRILDRNVSLARLMGANRRYIEEEIPHISSLMCENIEELLAHAEVIVIGNVDAVAAAALDGATPRQVVIDLTRGMARKKKLERQLVTAA